MELVYDKFAHKNPERYNVFLRADMCEVASEDMKTLLCISNSKWAFEFNAGNKVMIPCREFIDWCSDTDVKFAVEACWVDGCSIYLKDACDAPIIKLRWEIPSSYI